jgi:hypothetical protein
MRLKLPGTSWLGKRLAQTPSPLDSESEGSMPILPFEAVLVAALNFGTKLIELIAIDRQTMDPETRAKLDAVRVAGLERVERIMAMVESTWMKGLQR